MPGERGRPDVMTTTSLPAVSRVVRRALDAPVIADDRRDLVQVQRLALRHRAGLAGPFQRQIVRQVQQDDIRVALLRDMEGDRRADIARADDATLSFFQKP